MHPAAHQCDISKPSNLKHRLPTSFPPWQKIKCAAVGPREPRIMYATSMQAKSTGTLYTCFTSIILQKQKSCLMPKARLCNVALVDWCQRLDWWQNSRMQNALSAYADRKKINHLHRISTAWDLQPGWTITQLPELRKKQDELPSRNALDLTKTNA